MRIETQSDSPTLARHVAKWMTSQAEVATGIFHVALSGGSTPITLLAADSFPATASLDRALPDPGPTRGSFPR
jgi:hypothetical protein